MSERRAYLLIFGPGPTGLAADKIFGLLFPKGIWFFPSVALAPPPGADLLFYQSGAGVVAKAKAKDSGPVVEGDDALVSQTGLSNLRGRVTFEDATEFRQPIKLGPIVDALAFIKNKKNYGLYLRVSPRVIPYEDYEKIVSSA